MNKENTAFIDIENEKRQSLYHENPILKVNLSIYKILISNKDFLQKNSAIICWLQK